MIWKVTSPFQKLLQALINLQHNQFIKHWIFEVHKYYFNNNIPIFKTIIIYQLIFIFKILNPQQTCGFDILIIKKGFEKNKHQLSGINNLYDGETVSNISIFGIYPSAWSVHVPKKDRKTTSLWGNISVSNSVKCLIDSWAGSKVNKVVLLTVAKVRQQLVSSDADE